MQPFTTHTGLAAVMLQDNINTDLIIPKQFLKTIHRRGLGRHLFHDLRYREDGSEVPGFVLNCEPGRSASFLLAGANFGCGSSREHAPWALLDFGIRCVISTSFADIFYNNCFQNGLLPIALPRDQVRALMGEAKGGNHVFSVDLETQTVTAPSGQAYPFDIDPGRKEKMLGGLDAIGETLQAAPDISAYEARRALDQPWLEAVR
jgi:3-isopropylmalate dehydratase small subunit